jgi:hypothetical protein
MDGELLMAIVVPAGAPVEGAESEPVILLADPYNARFILDDGMELVFDRDELRKALVVRGEQAA